MFCPNCSEANPDDAKFCGKCGRPMPSLSAAAAATTASSTPSAMPKPAPTSVSDGLKWGIFAATILIPVLGVVMGVIYLADANSDKKAVGRLWVITGGIVALLWILFQCGQSNAYYS